MVVLRNHKLLLLMVSLLILIVLSPLITDFSGVNLTLNIFFSVTLLTCIFAISHKRNQLILGALISAPYLIAIWVNQYIGAPGVRMVGLIFGILYFFYITVILLINLLEQPEVDLETIFGAISAYLLMGLAWSLIYNFIETVLPGSFSLARTASEEHGYAFIYFSYITLTTLGYGDITPVTAVAKSWCILEATVGQIYLVVLVAGLVGHYISNKGQTNISK